MKKRFVCIAIACVSATLIASACTGKRGPRHYTRAERLRFIKEHHLDKLPRSDVPLEVNERVVAWMDYFSGSGERHFSRYLARSGRYVPMMQDILRKHGLPQDLVYIALIESGFNTHAQSHAAAVGPWQFIKGTGRRYGMRIDAWVDERRDPVKSTHAAARYLKDLYREFSHWYLAMAAYNAGEGRVRHAIADSGSRNFWVHADSSKKYLRAETRDYVPKYIAANIMAKMPREFGFGEVDYWEPQEYDIVHIPSQTDLDVAAKCAGARRSELEELNPELSLGATPPNVTQYALRIPKDRKEQFRVAYAKVPKEERVKLVVHHVRRGERLISIARKYGVSSRALARANGIGRRARLRTGTQLIIPIGAAYKVRMASLDEGGGDKKSTKKLTHKVRKGDTVGGIAHKYGVTVSQLKQWNGLNKRGTIRVGQRLKIYRATYASAESKSTAGKGGTAGSHRVRPGETLWTIARTYDVSVSDLKDWNNLEGNRIKPGQKLAVRTPATSSMTSTADVPAAPSASSTSGGPATHTLAEGQTLGHVAEMYGVSSKDIMRWNGIKDPRRVRAGTKLVIKGGGTKAPSVSTLSPSPAEASTEKVAAIAPAAPRGSGASGTHVLAEGQTLGHVAEMYGVSSKDIMRWNGIKDPRRVRAGTKLVIKGGAEPAVEPQSEESSDVAPEATAPTPAPSPAAQQSQAAPSMSTGVTKTYRIKSGDSLWSIARQHGVSVSDIKRWNGMGESNKIKPGQKIVIKKM